MQCSRCWTLGSSTHCAAAWSSSGGGRGDQAGTKAAKALNGASTPWNDLTGQYGSWTLRGDLGKAVV